METGFPDWRPVTCGVLQGLVVGPLFFIININNLDENLWGMTSKFDGQRDWTGWDNFPGAKEATGDLIEVYKIMKSIEMVVGHNLYPGYGSLRLESIGLK